MKIKRIVSFAVSLCVLICTFSFSVGASSGAGRLQNELLGARFSSSEVNAVLPEPDIKLAVNTSTYRFYDNLTSAQKAIYNAFVSTRGGLKSTP